MPRVAASRSIPAGLDPRLGEHPPVRILRFHHCETGIAAPARARRQISGRGPFAGGAILLLHPGAFGRPVGAARNRRQDSLSASGVPEAVTPCLPSRLRGSYDSSLNSTGIAVVPLGFPDILSGGVVPSLRKFCGAARPDAFSGPLRVREGHRQPAGARCRRRAIIRFRRRQVPPARFGAWKTGRISGSRASRP